jgi:hypothetical protein
MWDMTLCGLSDKCLSGEIYKKRIKELKIPATLSQNLYLPVKLQGVLFQMSVILIARLPHKVKSKHDPVFN